MKGVAGFLFLCVLVWGEVLPLETAWLCGMQKEVMFAVRRVWSFSFSAPHITEEKVLYMREEMRESEVGR